MVRFTWIPRTLLAVLLLAVVLIAVSGTLELTGSVRLASAQARAEANLVTRSVIRELNRLASEHSGESVDMLADDDRVREVLFDALALAPSVLHVGVANPDGVIVAHTQPSLVGAVVPTFPPLPDVRTFQQSLAVLWDLTRRQHSYELDTALLLHDLPFARVRVVMAGSFLLDAIRQAASRGIVAAVIIIALAVGAGVLLTRLAMGHAHRLGAGVAALREGRFDQRFPEDGLHEFSYLARELNLLGMKFEEERRQIAQESGTTEGEESESSIYSAVWRDQSRVMLRLGQTAAGVAHELRNQLQVVQLSLQELRRAEELTRDQIRLHVVRAAQGVESLSGAVSGFLKIARVKPMTPRPLMINELLEEVARELRTETALAGIQLQVEFDAGIAQTWADSEVLRQALHNLVRNSLQALSGIEGRVILRSALESDQIRITVDDNGPGIPEAVLEHVFDLYFTTRKDGSGVGLALVRQAAEMHGGDVAIDSKEGTGTCVTIQIPLRRVAAFPPSIQLA